ncbi:MAG: hypothetical protein IJ060_03535 [Oscillospiraceae bacterium]|nr:hypothetical protein [Oscillospiraceae bacterium]
MKQQDGKRRPDTPAPEEPKQLCCLRCGADMHQADTEKFLSGSLLLTQLQKIAANAGIRIYHCEGCGKIEFYKSQKRSAES